MASSRIDGQLNDATWASASVLTGFSPYTPVDRQPAADSTDVQVMYTDHAIYFGIRAYEPNGSATATLADPDKLGSNDHISLILDTFDD